MVANGDHRDMEMREVTLDKAARDTIALDTKPARKRPFITPLRVIALIVLVSLLKWLHDFFVRETILKPSDTPVVRWPPGHSTLNSSRAMYITMRPHSLQTNVTLTMIQEHAGFQRPEVSVAVNGREVDPKTLPLYTRNLMLHGRHEHSQVSTPGMVGCYMSHVKVLEQMRPGDVFAVFEEDAAFSSRSIKELQALDAFVRGELRMDFDLIYTGVNNNPPPSGTETRTYRVSPQTTLTQCFAGCSVWGTRGYVVTYRGAQRLLKHARPLITQIDALFSLVAAFEGREGFKMFFLNKDVVLGPRWIDYIGATQVQDECLKCYLPTGFWPYIWLIAFFVFGAFGLLFILGWHLLPMCGVGNSWMASMFEEAGCLRPRKKGGRTNGEQHAR
eukprot:CAMPEP_0174932290 /NCGR_PEP_ID=MMETSP1355-20121228/35620_1 /TAXON_ID=464990 /ORGANISM="Hemiselmis tepida, Strain CCMP443" /LENGTH=387 /DNA_ID=CAMNT_0016178691 /DNA_START=35 /DNA_END=1195 /DNA_ORIENTATION=-